MTATVIVIFMFSLLAMGAPIGFALIIAGSTGVYWIGGWSAVTGILSSMPKTSASTYEFLTIPMFLLMAEFVLRSGIADDLFRAAAAWFGRVRGGLGIATSLAGAGFGAICGSSTAAAATLSATSLPAMLRYGYEKKMASGVVAISGTLSMLIPPSIAMVIYAMLADVSIGRMLIAGVIPGILVTFTIAATVYVLAWWRPDDAPLTEKVSLGDKFYLLRLIGPMLVLMASVTGVIYTGIATPTEASALGALVAGILYVSRVKPQLSDIVTVVVRSTKISCMLGIIILGAHIFTAFFALTQTTQTIIAWVGSINVESWVVVAAIIIVVLVMGFFMDQTAILVLTVPIVAPLLSSLGYDLIWFGVIKIVTAEIGLVTPPFGLNCFVVARYSNMKASDVFWGVLPHVISHMIAVSLLLLVPAISLWLPNHMQ